MKTRVRSRGLVACAIALALLGSAAAAAQDLVITTVGPTVRVMPDGIKTPTKHTAYAWAGKTIAVWGSVAWGDSTSGNYAWDFGDGTAVVTGAVSDARYIAVNHAYAAAGTYFASLTVTDGNSMSDLATVRIDVLPVDDGTASINLAIERGLTWIYRTQRSDGSWYHNYGGYTASPTAMSLLALQNRGHFVIGSTDDIYHNTLVRGFAYLSGYLRYSSDISNQTAGNPDTHGIYPNRNTPDGRMVDIPDSGRSNYETGITMMAYAAAGPYTPGSDPYDATVNPALNYMVSVRNQSGGTISLRLYDILAGLVDYVAWAQTDTGGGRGAWRYSGNNSGGDNSVAQWPAIGAEAAEYWGIYTPAFVKNEMLNYWVPATFTYPSASGSQRLGGWGYENRQYQNIAHAGAGLCMLSWLGIPKTDPRVVATLNFLDTYWAGGTTTAEGYGWAPWTYHMGGGSNTSYYTMYGVAKGARIARDSSGGVSQITMIGSRDWYALYSAHILSQQQSDGSWPTTMGGYHYPSLNTPWAILVLIQNIASLRPQASITASPNPVPANTLVAFDISGSTHQDPTKYLVSWKLDYDAGNGVNWTSPDRQGGFPVAGPINKVGGYADTGVDRDVTATLLVTDNFGETAEATVVVRITSSWVAPVANPGGPYFGAVGTPVTLTGAASYSPNTGGSIVRYEWDLDGNGSYEVDAGANPTYSKTWATPYIGQVGLRVTDNTGRTSTASVYTKITVSDLKPVSYPLVSLRRLSLSVWEYTFRFVIRNQGTGDTTNVSAVLQNWPAQVTVVDGAVTFGNVAAGATVTSSDTFKIRVNRNVSVQSRDLTWRLTFTDSAGTTWVLVNFPLY